MEKTLFKTEERADRNRVVTFLRDLADKIEQNELVLKSNGDEVPVDLPDTVTLEVELEEEIEGDTTEHSLEVELEWVPGQEGGKGGTISLG